MIVVAAALHMLAVTSMNWYYSKHSSGFHRESVKLGRMEGLKGLPYMETVMRIKQSFYLADLGNVSHSSFCAVLSLTEGSSLSLEEWSCDKRLNICPLVSVLEQRMA